jgi:hypothetical protein
MGEAERIAFPQVCEGKKALSDGVEHHPTFWQRKVSKAQIVRLEL